MNQVYKNIIKKYRPLIHKGISKDTDPSPLS